MLEDFRPFGELSIAEQLERANTAFRDGGLTDLSEVRKARVEAASIFPSKAQQRVQEKAEFFQSEEFARRMRNVGY